MPKYSFQKHGVSLINSRLYKLTANLEKPTSDVLKKMHSLIDLTSLSTSDNFKTIKEFVETGVNNFRNDHPSVPYVAGICVYPRFVETVRETLTVPGIKIVSVAGGFPHSQTPLKIKIAEIEHAVSQGADEIDVVINVGDIIGEDIKTARFELEAMKRACGDALFKVIVESGAYAYDEDLYNASITAMQAGADFIKTSTGKQQPAATPRAALVMCLAIRDYERAEVRKVGFKAAGGVKTPDEGMAYWTIVKEILGESYLSNHLFRIGATSLSKNLVKTIEKKG